MDKLTLSTPADLRAGVTVPANHTAEYHDAQGNLVAHYDVTRPYDKRCKVDHFADHGYTFPLTVTFTEHEPEPDAAHVDDDFAEPITISGGGAA